MVRLSKNATLVARNIFPTNFLNGGSTKKMSCSHGSGVSNNNNSWPQSLCLLDRIHHPHCRSDPRRTILLHHFYSHHCHLHIFNRSCISPRSPNKLLPSSITRFHYPLYRGGSGGGGGTREFPPLPLDRQ